MGYLHCSSAHGSAGHYEPGFPNARCPRRQIVRVIKATWVRTNVRDLERPRTVCAPGPLAFRGHDISNAAQHTAAPAGARRGRWGLVNPMWAAAAGEPAPLRGLGTQVAWEIGLVLAGS